MKVPEQASSPREWVNQILDPKQRCLALAIPALCGLAGLTPEDLAEGRKSSANDQDVRVNSFRTLILGAVVSLGMDLGIRRMDLHDATEIRDLSKYHRYSLLRAERRFHEFLASGGVLGDALKSAYEGIQYEVMVLARTLTKRSAPLGYGSPPTSRPPPQGD